MRTALIAAVRSLKRSPRFALTAAATLSIGIAAITSIFAVANAVYLRPLPFADSERLVAIGEVQREERHRFSVVTRSVVPFIKQALSFERVASYKAIASPVTLEGFTAPIGILQLDEAFPQVIEVRAQLGRMLSPAEIRQREQVVVISDFLWRRRFHSNPGVIGTTISILGQPHQVIGVLAPSFRFPSRSDLFMPLRLGKESDRDLSLVGRLRQNATIAEAQAELKVIQYRLAREGHLEATNGIVVRREPLDRQGNQLMPQPVYFFVASGLVLLVASTNVRNLFRLRFLQRRAELAIKSTLGATTAMLARELFLEAALVTTAAAGIGIIVSALAVSHLDRIFPTQGLPYWITFKPDIATGAFISLVAVTVSALVGSLPARIGSASDLHSVLRGNVPNARLSRAALGGSLVAQVAVAVAFGAVALVLGGSFRQLVNVNPGYDAHRILSLSVHAETGGQDQNDLTAIESVLAPVSTENPHAIVALRGTYRQVRGADTSGNTFGDFRLFVGDDTVAEVRLRPQQRLYVVSDHYLKLMGINVIAGRAFNLSDRAAGALVALVSRELLAQSSNSVGLARTIRIGSQGAKFEVVGVVEDVRELQPGPYGYKSAPRPDVYLAARQVLAFQPEVLATTSGGLPQLSKEIGWRLSSAFPRATIFQGTLGSQFDELVFVTKILGGLLGIFGGATMFLALIGLYVVAAWSVSLRTRELGVRIALGASRLQVGQMVVREAIGNVFVGAVLGLAIGISGSTLIRSMLVDTQPANVASLAILLVLIAILTTGACYVPVLRAMRIQPANIMK